MRPRHERSALVTRCHLLTGESVRMDDHVPIAASLATLPVGVFLAAARQN